MELARQSNLGSLITAVLVGLLALASNHYVQMRPQILSPWVQWIFPDRSDAPSTAARLRALQKVEERLVTHFTVWQRGETRRNVDPEFHDLVACSDHVWQQLQADPATDPEQLRTGRLTRLSSYFLAAEMDPKRFSSAFRQVADEVIETAHPTDSAHAAMLVFYHQHSFDQPDAERLLKDLRKLVETYCDPRLGAKMYSIVAKELWQHGHQQLADRVLQEALQRYAGQPSVSRLLNQRLDQQPSCPEQAGGCRMNLLLP